MKDFADEVNNDRPNHEPDGMGILIKVFVENVRSNILLTADNLKPQHRDRAEFDTQIKRSRRYFQMFCDAKAQATKSRACSKPVDSVALPATAIPTVASGPGLLVSGPSAVSAAVALQSVEDIEDADAAMASAELTTAKGFGRWPGDNQGCHGLGLAEVYEAGTRRQV